MKRFCWTTTMLLMVVMYLSASWATAQQGGVANPCQVPSNLANIVGTWEGTYVSNNVPKTTVTLIVQQCKATVTGTYLTGNGAQGVMYGMALSGGLVQLHASQQTPTCQGEFNMPIQVNGNNIGWSFDGYDCLGIEKGSGTATRQP
jgi:hypothetical protein